MKILITGGAGFVGSYLATCLQQDYPEAKIFAFDNLHRRGSEINLSLLKEKKITFLHGDIRIKEDLLDLEEGPFDLLIEASAEPSVLAGVQGSPHYCLQTNLMGTINCLELMRKHQGRVIFLSTSRVYSINSLREIPLKETKTRLTFNDEKATSLMGIGREGITEKFSVEDHRSLYGTSKFCSEKIIEEYVHQYNLKAIINRLGVIAGPGQWGKSDQGVFTFWMVRHFFGGNLSYNGFGGKGLQVRDLLHPKDLYELIKLQIDHLFSLNDNSSHVGLYNAGGGESCSTSLLELTGICQEITQKKLSITSKPETNIVDIPYYITDNTKVKNAYPSWKVRYDVPELMKEIHHWISSNSEKVRPIFY